MTEPETPTGANGGPRALRRTGSVLLLAAFWCTACGQGDAGTRPLPAPSPPFGGTIFIDADIITADDSTTFVDLVYVGQDTRQMFDRRAGWVTLEPFLFNAAYSDGFTVEVQVNPEFLTPEAAQEEAVHYAEAAGRLPRALRHDVETMWIHKGIEPFGGGNRNLLIHTGQGRLYELEGILEETLVHEAAHTSLDDPHASAAGWIAAQAADPTFISTYARDHPQREDIAESFLPYLAVRVRRSRISASLAETILETIPNRIAYFDGLDLDLGPVH